MTPDHTRADAVAALMRAFPHWAIAYLPPAHPDDVGGYIADRPTTRAQHALGVPATVWAPEPVELANRMRMNDAMRVGCDYLTADQRDGVPVMISHAGRELIDDLVRMLAS